MKMKKLILASAALALLAACATMVSGPTTQEVTDTIKASFADKGIAKVDRLNQSEAQKTCSEFAQTPLPNEKREQLQKAALDGVKYPADGKYLGDWKEGEKVAQNGRGLQYSDDAKTVNGGNCYACHQIQKAEISYGNLGPSLLQYGKLRGDSEPILKYTWAKIFNSHSYNACSNMPRYGAAEILTEKQLKDVMALLLDPQSPVNK
jgi:L-cysteine S-thiosulfotransferase